MNPYLIIALIGLAYAAFGSTKKAEARKAKRIGGPSGPSPRADTPARGGGAELGPYDPDAASALAVTLVQDLVERGRKADKALIKAFQAASGVAPDGKYGPETKGALDYWLYAALGDQAPGAPAPHYGTGEVIYSAPDGIARTSIEIPAEQSGWPPVAGPDENAAVFYAPLVAEATSSGKGYRQHPNKVKAVRAFQLASGITVDGLYGPTTRGALVYWLGQQHVYTGTAPTSLYGRGTKAYRPGG